MGKENIEDLLADDSFVRWIEGNAAAAEQKKWENWLRKDPARTYKIRQAKKILKSLRFEEEIPNTIGELNLLRDAVEKQNRFSQAPESKSYFRTTVLIVLFCVAALPFILRNTGWNAVNQQEETEPVYETVETGFGQLQNITFPDGTEVVLNANSRLSYPALFSGGEVEMELDGEAFFTVTPAPDTQEERVFSVRTADGEVHVLGTRFNVNTRRQHTEVVLEEGVVLIEPLPANSSETRDSADFYTMKPGELARFSAGFRNVDVAHIDPSLYTSWRHLELHWKDTPLYRIAERIEQTYGIDVVFADERLRELRFSGTAPNKNLSVLLEGLRTLLDEPVREQPDKIIIGESPKP